MSREDARLLWRCRRGARELDSLLVPYGSSQIHGMTVDDKSNLGRLLEQQDPDLLDWFLERSTPEDSLIAEAVRNILIFSKARKQAKDI